jgi:SAM-dependent methyltransferase
MMPKGRLAFCIQNNHFMVPMDFFWTYLRMLKPSNSFAVEGAAAVKASCYNEAIYKAIALGAEWFFCMDVDQMFPVNTIPRLFDVVEKYDAKIVSVLYHIGRAPFGPVAGWVKKMEDGRNVYTNSNGNPWRAEYAPLGDGVVEVDWVGSGGLLIHKSVIDAIGWPPFLDVWTPGQGTRDIGHDINFCLRAKEKGFKVYVDTGLDSAHGKFTYVSKLYAQGFNEANVVQHMDGILHRQALEADYWDTVWQTELIKSQSRGKSYSETLKNLEELVPEKSRVADLGCGAGDVISHLRDTKNAVCTGYDFSERAIEIIKQKGFDGTVVDLRNFSPNGESGSFDVVVSTHTIEHLQDDHGLISAMKKLSRPGGKVVIVTPWREEIQGHFEHVRGYTDDEMDALMKQHFQDFSVTKNNRDYVAVGLVD